MTSHDAPLNWLAGTFAAVDPMEDRAVVN